MSGAHVHPLAGRGVPTDVHLFVTGTLEPRVLVAGPPNPSPVTLTSFISLFGARGGGPGPTPGTASGDGITWTQTVVETANSLAIGGNLSDGSKLLNGQVTLVYTDATPEPASLLLLAAGLLGLARARRRGTGTGGDLPGSDPGFYGRG